MCGIFGWYIPPDYNYNSNQLKHDISLMLRLSESRGKEAAGVALYNKDVIHVYRAPLGASKMIKSKPFKMFIKDTMDRARGRLSLIGHARLVTDGNHFINENNQPVTKDGLSIVHNGIVTNQKELWSLSGKNSSRKYQVDTEIILNLFRSELEAENKALSKALKKTYEKIEGIASIGLISESFDGLIIATNNGSLYYAYDDKSNIFIFASERFILSRFLNKTAFFKFFREKDISHLKVNNAIYVDKDKKSEIGFFDHLSDIKLSSEHNSVRIMNYDDKISDALQNMRRCTKCILPETMPFIKFDSEGVCNYCHNYSKVDLFGAEVLKKMADKIRGDGNTPDCIAMFSGGRDSCYGLHYIKKELGLTPLAYTYDWGMITDIGRRNQSRMCGKLGVEHILVSADISKKRHFIRKNIEAWLKQPRLGMVPIFMAGDKQYFYFIDQIKRSYGISDVFVFENPLEATRFKSGFCGVDESGISSYDNNLVQKFKLFYYYCCQYIMNPRYVNLSIFDSAFALWSYYFTSHDFTYLFRYMAWDEDTINETLINNYNWETDKETPTTWRIGDGTAAFYNYIYMTVAGFTENDTLRSNQIREGLITRSQALDLVKKENQPRWESLEWYSKTVGFNLSEALTIINNIPKLYYS